MGSGVKLRVLSRYRNGSVDWSAGSVIEVTPEIAAFLKDDSPGSFVTEEETPAVEEETPAVKRKK